MKINVGDNLVVESSNNNIKFKFKVKEITEHHVVAYRYFNSRTKSDVLVNFDRKTLIEVTDNSNKRIISRVLQRWEN